MNKQNLKPDLIAHIKGNNSISGEVKFFSHGGAVLVMANIQKLPKTETNFFAFHIHEGKSCGGDGFSETRAHFNPQNTMHPLHSGDLPPLYSVGGTAYMAFLTDRFTTEDILKRTIVIHDMPDDFRTQPAGNSGTKIACGVIEKN